MFQLAPFCNRHRRLRQRPLVEPKKRGALTFDVCNLMGGYDGPPHCDQALAFNKVFIVLFSRILGERSQLSLYRIVNPENAVRVLSIRVGWISSHHVSFSSRWYTFDSTDLSSLEYIFQLRLLPRPQYVGTACCT